VLKGYQDWGERIISTAEQLATAHLVVNYSKQFIRLISWPLWQPSIHVSFFGNHICTSNSISTSNTNAIITLFKL